MSFIINPYQFGLALHPRLVAWLARGTALGYTLPSAAQQTKLNTFFYALDSAGIITGNTSSLLDVLYIFAIDGSSDMATINVITPTSFQCSKVNSPTFTSNQGFTGNGTSSYLDSGYNFSSSSVNYVQASASVGVGVNNNIQSVSPVSDAGSGTFIHTSINPRNASNQALAGINGPVNSVTVSSITSSIGLWHIRGSNNTQNFFKDGSQIGTGSQVFQGIPSRKFVMLATHGTAGTIISFTAHQVTIGWAGASLSGLESAFYTAWNTYFTSL